MVRPILFFSDCELVGNGKALLAFPFSHTDAHIDERQGKHLRHSPVNFRHILSYSPYSRLL
jgi:hypothetical protein